MNSAFSRPFVSVFSVAANLLRLPEEKSFRSLNPELLLLSLASRRKQNHLDLATD